MMASEDDRTADELAELRAELARFVLKEAGAAAAETPDLGLGPALTGVVDAAVRESLEKALRGRRDLDPAAYVERVLRLAEAQTGVSGRAGYGEGPASGWAQVVDGCRRRPLGVAAALVILLAATFALGWFAHGQIAPTPAAVAAPTSASAGEVDPDGAVLQSQASSPAPSGQPAVLSGVEVPSRSPAHRHAAGGRAP